MDKISTIIITHNEEHNIAAALDAALQVSDEIIVVDSGSTDKTKEICLEYGVTFITQKWLGFSKQRNFAATLVENDYILALDADEVLDDTLIKSINQLKEEGFTEQIYLLNRLNFYYVKFIRHGMENMDLKARLYHKSFAKWNDKFVHEDLEYATTFKTVLLKGHLLHYAYDNISQHIIKADKYTTLAAEDYYRNGKKKPGFIKLVLSPAFTFIKAFFLKRGFLDGWQGWILAKFHANGVLLKYAKLRMMYEEKSIAKDVSLIITTYNWVEALKLTLLSVASQQVLPTEVIIADDGSRPETKQFIDKIRKVFPVPIVHVWQKDNGYQRTLILNEAVRNSAYGYIIQVDGDIVLHDSFIKDHLKVAEKGFFVKGSRCLLKNDITQKSILTNNIKFGIFSPGINNRFNALRIPFIAPFLYYSTQNDISGVIGCNMAFWKKDFIKVNGYNNDIVGWGREDSEIAARLINNGLKKKRAKLMAICYHLHHSFLSRDKDEKNITMLNDTINGKVLQCAHGYNVENESVVYR
jgi:glycosyltransferase involved in cell wall biosynthesis